MQLIVIVALSIFLILALIKIRYLRKGYDELGRSITEVYKAGQLLNRTVSSESALSSDIKRANDLYKEQLASIRE